MDQYNWPQYPTVRQVVEFEQDLWDNVVRFNIGTDDYGIYLKSTEETVTGQRLTNGQRITKSTSTML